MPTITRPTTATAAAPGAAQPTKSALVLKLLTRTKGATIAEMAEPTGWQPHSTRAYLSGLRKQGANIVREKRKTGETVYRIGDPAPAEAVPVVPAEPSPQASYGSDLATPATA